MGILKSIRNRIPESRRKLTSKKAKDYCAMSPMSLDSGETDAIFSQEDCNDVFFSQLVERKSPNTESVVARPEIVSPLKSPIKEDEEDLFPILSCKNNDWVEINPEKSAACISTLTDDVSIPVVPKITKSLFDDIESSAEASESSTEILQDLVGLKQTEKSTKSTIAVVSPEKQKGSLVVEGTTTPTTSSPPKAIESPLETLGNVATFTPTITPTISNKATIANANVVPAEIKTSLQHNLKRKEKSLVRNLIEEFDSGTAGSTSISTRPRSNRTNISVITFGRKKGSLVHFILYYIPDFESSGKGKVENIFESIPKVEIPQCGLSQNVVDTSNQIRDEFKDFCEHHAATFSSVCSDVPRSDSSKGDDQKFEMLVFNKADRINRVLLRLKDLTGTKKGKFTMQDGSKIPHFFVEEKEDTALFTPAFVDDDEETVYSSHTASFKSLKEEEKKPVVVEVEPEEPNAFQGTVDGMKKELDEFYKDHATMEQVQKGVAEFCDDQSVVFSVAASRAEVQTRITYDTLKESLFEVLDAIDQFSLAFRCGVRKAEDQVAAIWDTIEYWEHDNRSTMMREMDQESTYQYAEA